jgi:4-amino-4-deoxy-L-arabinose transferase-like glycosyltransferase
VCKTDPSARLQRRFLFILIAIAFAVRLGWGFSRPVSDEALAALPDQREYLELGRNLLGGQGLSFVDPRFGQRVDAFRMPGYPLFVAACGGNVQTIRAAQAALDASTVLAIFLLARQISPKANRRTACIAAAIVAFNPMLVYVSSLILSETLFIAMLAWGMVLLLAGFVAPEMIDNPNDESLFPPRRVPVWAAGGMLLALAVLVRPSAGALPLILGIGAICVNCYNQAAYQSSTQSSGGRNLAAGWLLWVGATMVLLVALVLLPWAWRNYRVLHKWIWTDTNAGITLYDGYNPSATGASDQRFIRNMPELRRLNEIERSQELTGQAAQFIRDHPSRVVRLALAKAGRTWSPMPLSEQFGVPQYQAIGLLYSVPFDLLVLWGLWRGNLRRSVKVFLMLPAIYLTLVHALTVGSLRYRLPAEPPLAVLAACAIGWKNVNRESNKYETEG